MKTFQYSFFAKLIYRFANIPITLVLLLLALFSLIGIFIKWYYIFPFMIDSSIMFFLNRYYLKIYKTFPFKIEADNEKMICSDYFFSNKKFEVKLSDITSIKGGIFSGTIARPIYLYVESQDLTIGINQHLKDYNKLVTVILSNIKQDLYNNLLNTMQQFADETKELKEKMKKQQPVKKKKSSKKHKRK